MTVSNSQFFGVSSFSMRPDKQLNDEVGCLSTFSCVLASSVWKNAGMTIQHSSKHQLMGEMSLVMLLVNNMSMYIWELDPTWNKGFSPPVKYRHSHGVTEQQHLLSKAKAQSSIVTKWMGDHYVLSFAPALRVLLFRLHKGEYSQDMFSEAFWTPNISLLQFNEYLQLYLRNKSSPN